MKHAQALELPPDYNLRDEYVIDAFVLDAVAAVEGEEALEVEEDFVVLRHRTNQRRYRIKTQRGKRYGEKT